MFPTEVGGLICIVGFKLLLLYIQCYIYVATMLYVESLHNHAIVASVMYHFVLIKTENIVVDEIGRIVCSNLLAHAHTYIYIKLLCMHDTAKYNIVAINSTVQ